MPIEYRCPIHHEPLAQIDATHLAGVGHGEVYPVLDGIPILLPDAAERERVAKTDWSQPVEGVAAIDFYNDARFETIYSTDHAAALRTELQQWIDRLPTQGPILEIGSGRGALQGLGSDYVALDYAFTALRRNISPSLQRVCATAEHLPFADDQFAFLFTIDALEHVPRADLAFKEINRVLQPGGIAYLLPAWHCVQWICDGVRKRPWNELTVGEKLKRSTIPIRSHPIAKAVSTLPGRMVRRGLWRLMGSGETNFRFRSLRPEYRQFWESDCDACSRLDSHEACLFFASRGYKMLSPGERSMRQILARHVPVVVQK